ncbi:iron-sulfur cluster assembly scaffold protein [Pontiella sp.]|uniref:iron-sulfur cluster assembly scaffold protein n=1 Tax=Pontiella sp. TaxID=2837462 RepID=UPI003562EAFC
MLDHVMTAIEERAKRFGPMRDANAYAKVHGECGDTAEIWLRIDGGKIRRGSFMADGCGWSRLCCAKAAALAEGMTIEQAKRMTQAQVLEAAGEVPADHRHCALLAAETIHSAVDDFLNPTTKPTLSQWLKGIIGK